MGTKNKLPEDSPAKRDSADVVVHQRSLSLSYEGPLPQAQEFALYEDACPGAGSRILGYMEAEQAHRHKLQDMEMRGALRSELLGLLAAYSVMLLLIGSAFVLALMGHGAVALGFLAAGVLAAVHKFIDGRPGKKTEPGQEPTPESDN